MRLSDATFAQLPPHVQRPAYDRSKLRTGVVHLGPGAFHRAHQAPVFDTVCARDPRWGVVGVSLHSPDVRAALAPQDGLYTLATLGEDTHYHVIGAVREILVAPENPEAVLARLTAPETEIVTLTITEKGYCFNAEGQLDENHPAIRADLASPERPVSAPGYLFEALRRRRAAAVKPFAIVSCDNIRGNGNAIAGALLAFSELRSVTRDDRLDRWKWFMEIATPNTMVDSITPATDDALRTRVDTALGMRDAWPVQREPFTQWVIEAGRGLPDIGWEEAGVIIDFDVAAYERAKLRILNASHSALAYWGSLRGHETVADAMADPELATFVRALMDELGAKLNSTIDPGPYKEAVLARFRNPAIRHLLSQIAWDGSQKLPNRLIPYLLEAVPFGWPIANSAKVLAAWFLFLRRTVQTGEKLTDPLAPLLLETAARAASDPARDVDLFLSLDAVFPPDLAAAAAFRAALIDAYAQLQR